MFVTDFSLFPKFWCPNQFSLENIASWSWKICHFCFQIWPHWVLPSRLCLRSFFTFPLDELYPLNWTNFPPKSTHQQKLLRGCYQNNATAEKEAFDDVIGKQIWRRNSTNVPTGDKLAFLSDEGPTARNVRLFYPYRQYTDLFIFRFVSLLCLRSTLRIGRRKLLK